MKIKTDTAINVALSGMVLVLLCSISAVISGLGTRWGLWEFRTGIMVLKWAACGELASSIFSLLVCIVAHSAGSKTALQISGTAFLIGIVSLILPLNMWSAAQRLPPIHDISTDTENPPRFDNILKLRKDSPNPAEYGGPEIADKQHQAYPDIRPLMLGITSDQAFVKALTAAQKMRWKIVSSNPAALIIEATDTTFWFGFMDDIVIRVTPYGFGSRIDVRSVSRVGRSDIGANAKRIRAFIKNLSAISK